MANDWKDRLGTVFSTNPDFAYEHTDDDDAAETLPPAKQKLRMQIEKKGRKGKTATLVKGFVGTEADLKELAKTLKTKCGVGGSVKEGEIIIQGEFKERIIEVLKTLGYKDAK